MDIFLSTEAFVVCLLGLPTLAYFYIVYKFDYTAPGQLSETIGNYSLFNTLYSIFLSMALVTLMVNFNTVQDQTRVEADSIISAARLVNGLSDPGKLKQSLMDYANSVVDYDLPAMKTGNMSIEASASFDALWVQAYKATLTSKSDENIHRLLLGELTEIGKARLTRRVKAKENLHPLVFFLIAAGYYVMLIKTYFTRVKHTKTQLSFEICMFVMIICIITTIVDLDTPFVGIVNVDTTPFNWALQKITRILTLS